MHLHPTCVRAFAVAGLLALALGWGLAPAAAADPPKWEPMLAKSFQGEAKDLGVTSLVVYRNPGCVFLQVESKGVYCSPAGAGSFKRVTETWKEVLHHAQQKGDPKHRFVLTDRGIKESTDGGTTWSQPIAVPRDFGTSSQAWVEYDATNNVVYLMKAGGDLYKLARGK